MGKGIRSDDVVLLQTSQHVLPTIIDKKMEIGLRKNFFRAKEFRRLYHVSVQFYTIKLAIGKISHQHVCQLTRAKTHQQDFLYTGGNEERRERPTW